MKTRSKFLHCLVSVLLVLTLLLPPGSSLASAYSSRLSTGIQQEPEEVWVDDDFTSETEGWNITHFNMIQDGVDAVAANGVVHVAEGLYTEQVVITKNLTLQGAGQGSIIKAYASMPTCFTTSYDHHPIVCVKEGAVATIDSFTIDGDGQGDTNYRFVGIAFRNAGGEIKNSEIKGIRNNIFSGAQHGVGIYAYNDDTIPYSISVLSNIIHDFQKNAMALNASDTTPLTVEVKDNVITGVGPTTVTAQNGIQVWADLGSGVIADNTVTGIGYDNTNSQTKWVATSILNFYADLEIYGNTISGAQVGIYNMDGSSFIHDNELSINKVGVSGYGIIATDPPGALPDPYDPIESGGLKNTLMSTRTLNVEIANNVVLFPDYMNYTNPDTIGIEADAGYGEADFALNIHHNDVRGFDWAIYLYQCNPLLGETCTDSIFTSIEVISNNLYDNNFGIFFGAGITTVSQVHYNRIFNNFSMSGVGITALSMVRIQAQNNWWGCNDGPQPIGILINGCVYIDASLADEVDYEPWLVLNLQQPSAVTAGQTIPIYADLIHTLTGEDTSADGTVMDGIEINFKATLGTFEFENVGTLNGVAINNYTAPTEVGTDTICVFLDAHIVQPICMSITVSPEPLDLSDLDLLVSTDQMTWGQVPGGLAEGFDLVLDPEVNYYYLDAANIVVNRPLADGYHAFYVDTYPEGYFAYWAGRDVIEGATGWQGVMWEIINGREPIFYLKVSGTQYDLIDGLLYKLYEVDQPLRIDGGYLLGEYTFSGEVEDLYGLTDQVTVGVTFYEPLALSDLDLLVSTDKVGWRDVPGSIATGFGLVLDPSVEYYYLDAANVVSNRPLADGYHAFYVDTYPEGYFDYWAGRGVVAGATGWQGVMWEIINGREPIFYLKVSESGTQYDLIDGLLYKLYEVDQPLRIDGGYLLGEYTFSGEVEDLYGLTDQVTVGVTFYEPLALSDLDLLVSTDKVVWEQVPGGLAEGFDLVLDPEVEYYYLDAANIDVNRPLKDGLHAFYFGDVPDGFFDYWSERGVYEGATGTWEPVMWEIINGDLPVFYLQVAGTEYDLIDGLLYKLYEVDQPLRIDGGYLPGAYTFSGEVEDLYGITDQVTVGVTFYEPLALTDLDLLVSTDQTTWDPVHGSIAAGFGLALDPSVEYYYLDAANVVSNRPLADGYHAFYVDTYPDGFFDYWAGRGVVDGATGWQGEMWKIINGEKPIFYLKVSGTQYDLIDCLQYQLGQVDQPLRIDGDYLPGEYTFSGEVEDLFGFTAQVTVGITFNDIPVAEGQSVETDEDTPIAVTLVAEDLFPGSLTWKIESNPAHGTLSGTMPALTYTPNANWHGTDSFTFTVSDGELVSAVVTVTITVNPVNDAPEAATLPNVEWLARQAHTLVIPAFTDADGDALTYTATLEDGGALPAWLGFDPATRTFSAAPTNAHVGEYVIKVTASDGKEQVSASFTLRVILNPFMIYMPIIAR